MIVSGYDNGDLKMFDLRRMGLHWETQLPNGICGLSFDRKDIASSSMTSELWVSSAVSLGLCADASQKTAEKCRVRTSAETILTLKNHELIHFGFLIRGFDEKDSIHDT